MLVTIWQPWASCPGKQQYCGETDDRDEDEGIEEEGRELLRLDEREDDEDRELPEEREEESEEDPGGGGGGGGVVGGGLVGGTDEFCVLEFTEEFALEDLLLDRTDEDTELDRPLDAELEKGVLETLELLAAEDGRTDEAVEDRAELEPGGGGVGGVDEVFPQQPVQQ